MINGLYQSLMVFYMVYMIFFMVHMIGVKDPSTQHYQQLDSSSSSETACEDLWHSRITSE